MNEFCVACGKALGQGLAKCAACGTEAAGAFKPTAVLMEMDAAFRAPNVCCCCLNPADTTSKQKHMVQQRGNTRQYATFPIPWCAACLKTFRIMDWTIKILFGLGALAGIGLGAAMSEGGAPTWLCWVAGIGAAAAVYFAAAKTVESRPSLNRRGHVSCCNSFPGATVSSREAAGVKIYYYRMVFGNREFARRLSEVAGYELDEESSDDR